MELGALVSLGPAMAIFGLTSAELAKILRCSRRDIGKELHFDATQWFSCQHVSVSFFGILSNN